MPKALSVLEKNILRSKGATDAQIKKMEKAGIRSKADFATVGDALTLSSLTGISTTLAHEIMVWAMPRPAPLGNPPGTLDSSGLASCMHCGAKQPTDYKPGDLCGACGKQAEPISTCFWCVASGPGSFCLQCGAEYVAAEELDIALLLKREGIPKLEVPTKLRTLSAAEKEVLWTRVRRMRG
jgi:hypothetical protein